MLIKEDEVRGIIVDRLNEWIETMPDPDKPLVGYAGRSESLSPRQIVRQVEDRTERGERLVRNWVNLAVDHIARSQVNAMSTRSGSLGAAKVCATD